MDQSTKPVSNSYKTFGLISLILGILAFIFSFVPCLGIFAIYPGILGIIFGVIGFILANKNNGAKGIIIAGIILSIIGTAVAKWQYNKWDNLAKETSKSIDSSFKSIDSSMKENDKQMDSISKSMDSIK